MQAAEKLVLDDEFDREYKHLRRPAAKVAKTDQSLQFSNTLRDQSIADNRKVRIRHGPAHVPERAQGGASGVRSTTHPRHVYTKQPAPPPVRG